MQDPRGNKTQPKPPAQPGVTYTKGPQGLLVQVTHVSPLYNRGAKNEEDRWEERLVRCFVKIKEITSIQDYKTADPVFGYSQANTEIFLPGIDDGMRITEKVEDLLPFFEVWGINAKKEPTHEGG